MKHEIDEEIFFFENTKGRSLLGFLHKPLSDCQPVGIIFCHSFADEKNLSHREIIQASRILAKNGYFVFRFDLSGCGDSDGELDEVTIWDWLKDLKSAIGALKERTNVKEYALWGLRVGASMVLIHAGQNIDVSFIVLWQPVLDLDLYIKQFLRRVSSLQLAAGDTQVTSVTSLMNRLNEDGKINVLGYPISKTLINSFISIGRKPFSILPLCPIFLLSVSPVVKNTQIDKYIDFLQSSRAKVEALHMAAQSFWDSYSSTDCADPAYKMIKWLRTLNENNNGRTRKV